MERFQAYISIASSLLELTDQEFWVAGVGLITDGGNAFLIQKSLTKTKDPYYDIYVKKKTSQIIFFIDKMFTQNVYPKLNFTLYLTYNLLAIIQKSLN